MQAKLDQYKHGKDAIDGSLGGAGDHSRHIERLQLNLDQEREALEAKENEVNIFDVKIMFKLFLNQFFCRLSILLNFIRNYEPRY